MIFVIIITENEAVCSKRQMYSDGGQVRANGHCGHASWIQLRLMKIAVLSDIHGNLPALEAVTADIDTWQPEMIIVDGDIVNGGPCSRACWQFVQKQQLAIGLAGAAWQSRGLRGGVDQSNHPTAWAGI